MSGTVSVNVLRRMRGSLGVFAAENPAPRDRAAIATLEKLVAEFASDVKAAAVADGIALDAGHLAEVETIVSHLKEGTDPMRHSQSALRARRDEYVDTGMLPAVDPLTDPAAGDVVSNVEVMEPVMKRYRATVTRTITETAVVEFDALETENLYAIAEDLVKAVPPDAWVDNAASDYGWIDRIDEVTDAAPAADPVAEALEGEDVPETEEEEPEVTAGRSRRVRVVSRRRLRPRAVRMAGADAEAAIDQVCDSFNSAMASADLTTLAGIDAFTAQLEALRNQLESISIDDDGTAEAARAESTARILYGDIDDALNAVAAIADDIAANEETMLDPVY